MPQTKDYWINFSNIFVQLEVSFIGVCDFRGVTNLCAFVEEIPCNIGSDVNWITSNIYRHPECIQSHIFLTPPPYEQMPPIESLSFRIIIDGYMRFYLVVYLQLIHFITRFWWLMWNYCALIWYLLFAYCKCSLLEWTTCIPVIPWLEL